MRQLYKYNMFPFTDKYFQSKMMHWAKKLEAYSDNAHHDWNTKLVKKIVK